MMAGMDGIKSRTFFGLFTAVALCTACSNRPDAKHGADEETVDGGTLVVGLAAEPETANVYLARRVESLVLANRILPRLAAEVVPEEGRKGGYEAEFAVSWHFENEGKDLVVQLHEAQWSDGTPFECADAVFTHAAQIDPDLGWWGASAKRHITSVECRDPSTVVYHYDSVYPGMFMDANDLHLLPRSIENFPRKQWRTTDWEKEMPAAGPFRVATVARGQEWVLERNEKYYASRGKPHLERIVMRVVPDATARITQLLSGDLDMITRIAPSDAARIEREHGLRLIRRSGWRYSYIGWNVVDPAAYETWRRSREAACESENRSPCLEGSDELAALPKRIPHPLLGDASVRRALTMAIDRPSIINTLLLGEGEIPASPILSPLPEHDPKLMPLPFDPEQARRLLAEAGFRDTNGDGILEKKGRAFSITMGVQAGRKVRRSAAEMIQNFLRDVGVKVEIRAIENSFFYQNLNQRKLDAWLAGWSASMRVDMTEMLYAGACAVGGRNFGCWSNEAADELALEARETVDQDQRAELWRGWERIFREQQPYTMLFRPHELIGVNARIKGVESLIPTDPLHGVESWSMMSSNSGGAE